MLLASTESSSTVFVTLKKQLKYSDFLKQISQKTEFHRNTCYLGGLYSVMWLAESQFMMKKLIRKRVKNEG